MQIRPGPRPASEILQAAEDHVHAARYAEADALVAEVLAREPGNGPAHYVAGLSILFRRQPAPALAHLEQALAAHPENAQFHFARAMALAELGRTREAIDGYGRALELRPAFFAALANMGNLLQRSHRRAEAIAAYRRALALQPDEAIVLTALGVCELAEGRVPEAIAALQRAIAVRPDHATAYNALGNAMARTGNARRAIELLRRATELRPGYAEAWANLAEQLHFAHEDAAAVAAYDRAVALDPGNEETRFRRDSVLGRSVDRAPDGFVRSVFDRYADDFDQRLTRDLGYRTPQDLLDFIGPWLGARGKLDVVDLGCGTGLSGIGVREHARRLVGVDLSARMLEQAARRSIYDQLVESEVVAFLDRCGEGAFDLAIALDVLVYIGNVSKLFNACARALKPGGVFALSTEDLEPGGEEFRLARTGRYAHSRTYVAAAAASAGLQPMDERAVVIRKENGQPVPGRLYAFAKPAA